MASKPSEIVGDERRHVPGDNREHAPQHVSGHSSADGDARGAAHVCLDCGEPHVRNDSLMRPFDMTCEKCLAIRTVVEDRIEESLRSIDEAEETGWYFKPVRPAWAKWRRVTP